MRNQRACRAVWRTRRCARNPAEVFQIFSERGERPIFLYSGDGNAPGGRYSLVALSPGPVFRASSDVPEDPFAGLRDALLRWTWRGNGKPPVPFIGGWVGYLSYDLAHRIERLRTAVPVDHTFPLMEFTFCRRTLAYDHLRQIWTAIELVDEDAPSGDSEKMLEDLLKSVEEAPVPKRDSSPALSSELWSNFSLEDYENAVRRVLAYIEDGDVYQVNLSQRFEGKLRISYEELALRLFEASPASFSAFLSFHGRAIISSSPERFLGVHEDVVEAWPVKGTRPRGATAGEDAFFLSELLASEKERAELIMITDLLRNDLGRVCAYGSVWVPELRAISSHAHVHHARSQVVGRLRPGVDRVDLLRATFPGGSVTGAPKIRAMEIIGELEPTARGPYCGAIGCIGVDGTMDLNIAIRTVLCEGERLTFQVGGGIVAESRPADEYEETLQKAKGILEALGSDVAGVRK